MTARFFHPIPIQRNAKQVVLTSAASHHAVQVLRLKSGQPITIFDGTGGEFLGYLEKISKSASVATIEDYQLIERESLLIITLVQAICTNEKMDWIIQKAVEQGVTHIQPVTTNRTLVRLTGERVDKRRQHWQKIIISACEQCGRNRIPQLSPLLPFSHWLEQKLLQKQENNKLLQHDIMLSPDAHLRLTELTRPGSESNITLLTGPEGGFTKEEIDVALLVGFTSVHMGKRILRAESAALAAIAAIQALWGDY